MHPDPTPVIEHAVPVKLIALDRLEHWARTAYTDPPRKYTEIIKVTPITIIRLGWANDPLVHEALCAQEHQVNYAVAALCIWLRTTTGRYVTSRLAIHRVPLDQWVDIVKPFADDCRRLGQIFGAGECEVKYAFGMRKLIALSGRTTEEADWEQEVHERTGLTTPKMACCGGIISTKAYEDIRDSVLDMIAQKAVNMVSKRGGSMKEFWDRRWWNTPKGTTSLGAMTKQKLKGLHNKALDLQLRPNKKTVMESMSEQGMINWMSATPAVLVRGSTKPEPGQKRRALLAVDDRTAFIAGYASEGIEQALTFDGMVLKQDPADVKEWVNFDAGARMWHVSNDYSNFNSLHSLRSLQEVSRHLAAAWRRINEPWAEEKALAEEWVVESYNRMFMSTPLGVHRMVSTLSSGHRNTARDNTILHKVYLECEQSLYNEWFGPAARMQQVRLCGDDEVGGYKKWSYAVLHTHIADCLGFTSQVSKGLLSQKYDEFLQLMRMPGSYPVYPVNATILTLCSGNWYKDPIRDLGSAIKDVSDHVWDIVIGGLSRQDGMDLATEMLNYLIQIKSPDNKLIPLEWIEFRGLGLPNGHPLWGDVITPAPPRVTLDAIYGKLPQAAAEASGEREETVWDTIGHQWRKRVIQARAAESYRQVAKNWGQRQIDTKYRKKWPVRKTLVVPPTSDSNTTPPLMRWRAMRGDRWNRSARAVAVRVGMPPELMVTDEFPKALSALSGRSQAELIGAMKETTYISKLHSAGLPPLLRIF
jgi:hypothetical protein